MEVAKTLILISIIILYPLFPGGLFCVVFGKTQKESFAKAFLLGGLLCGAMFAVLSFVCVRKGSDLALLSKASLLMWAAVLGICIVLLVALKKYRVFMCELGKDCIKRPDWYCVVMGLAFLSVAVLYVVRPFPLETGFDTPEQVVTVLDTGVLRGVDALSGQVQPIAGNWKDQISNLHLFYACLCKWSELSPVVVLFDVIPFVTLCAAFCVISVFSNVIFGKGKKSVAVFVMFALITLCGNSAYMNTSYGILHVPYEPATIFSSVVLPLIPGFALTKERVISFLLVMINGVFLAGVYKGIAIMSVAIISVLFAMVVVFLAERRNKTWML